MTNNYQMTDDELCALIDRESANCMGNEDLLSQARQAGMEYYLGEATGYLAAPDADRSSVVSKDLMDVVEWIMPSAMRLFTGTDEVARFEGDSPEDEKGALDATRLVQHVIMERNDGFRILHDAIKNSLIQRMGVVKVFCEETTEHKHETYYNLSSMDVESLSQDNAVEIIEQQQVDEQLFNIVVKRTIGKKEYRVEGVPPEEFGYSRECRIIDNARYVEQKVRKTKSELITMGVDPDVVADMGSDESTNVWGGEAETRNITQGSYTWGDEDAGSDSEQEVTLTECYIRCDYDGDGISEYRRVVKVGTTVLENSIVDEHPFALFTPILMPYMPVGLSMYDLVEDIMRVKTVLTRQVLDSAYLANNPRTEVLENAVNFDDLLNPRIGGAIRVKQMGSIREIATPFVGESGLAVINYFNGVRDSRTGVTEFNQGLGANTLAGTNVGSNGVQDMMNGAMQRIELMLRVIAETGIKRVWQLMLKELSQYQDREMQLKVNGRWMAIDPREWKNQFRVTISVGVAAASRQQQIANLQTILQLQQMAGEIGLSDPSKGYNALSRLTEQMGYRDAEQFWTNPENAEPVDEEPPVDPAVQVAQIKAESEQQLVQVKAQTDIQVESAKQQSQNEQAKAEQQMRLASNQMEIESKERLEKYKFDMQMELERYKSEMEYKKAIDTAHINAQARIGQSVAADSESVGVALYNEQEESYDS